MQTFLQPRLSAHIALRARPSQPHAQRRRQSHILTAWFKNPLRQDSETSGTYGSQKREDYTEDDVEQYFNYMGMLANEGTYDRLQEMLNTGTPAVDLLLLMAASENDCPKIAELIRAGADLEAKDVSGKSALEIATSEDVQQLLKQPKLANTF